MGKLYTAHDVRGGCNQWISHSNAVPSDDPDDLNAPAPKTAKAKRRLPAAMIRNINMNPKSGPQTWCDLCHNWFTPAYCKPVNYRFRLINACADCRRDRQLH